MPAKTTKPSEDVNNPNLAKAYLPPVGTEDGRTGPGRGRDVWQIVHVPGWALAI